MDAGLRCRGSVSTRKRDEVKVVLVNRKWTLKCTSLVLIVMRGGGGCIIIIRETTMGIKIQ